MGFPDILIPGIHLKKRLHPFGQEVMNKHATDISYLACGILSAETIFVDALIVTFFG